MKKQNVKKLELAKETVRELTHFDGLKAVAGGADLGSGGPRARTLQVC
jgi:hypothetical protein